MLGVRSASAQCDLNSKKNDFDGSVTYWTDQVKIASDGVGILGDQFDCRYRIFLHFVFGSNKVVLVVTEREKYCGCTPGSITVKFANGVVVDKGNLRLGKERTNEIGESEHPSYFNLTKDELVLFATEPVAKFRIKELRCPDHIAIEDAMPRKAAERIREDAACVLKSLD